MRHKITSWVLLFLLTSPTVVSSKVKADQTIDGRFGTRCLPVDGYADGLCNISIYKLMASPEVFHNKHVRVTGFLIRTLGSYVIFPSREAFLSSGGDGGIEINGSFSIRGLGKVDIERGAAPITVIGRFDGWYEGGGTLRVGSIAPDNVYYLPNIPESNDKAS